RRVRRRTPHPVRPRSGDGGLRLPGRRLREAPQEPRASMTEKALRLGTRRSKLAMAQSRMVADAVSQVTGRPVELVPVTTYGDISREHLAQIGGTGVFVAALREALQRGEVDFAVHSLKDLPTTQPEGLVLAAIPEREDPRDVLVARDALKFTDLPEGARIG